MQIVTAQVETSYAGVCSVPPGFSVVLPDPEFLSLKQGLIAAGEKARVSRIGDYIRPYCGQDLNGKSLLAYRGHGIGDQMIWAGCLRILKSRYPQADIWNYAHPAVNHALWHDPAVLPFRPEHLPIPFLDWKTFHYHLIGEGMCESNREPDQWCIWDNHLGRLGIDPNTVPPEDKRAIVPIDNTDRADAATWLQLRGIASAAPLLLWQLAATSPIRSYPPENTRAALRILADAFPAGAVVVAGADKHLLEYGPFAGNSLPPNVHLCCSESIRTVFALLERAACIVCPDSCFGHAAAALDTPAVSLWSSFHPRDRIKYYPRHLPIYQPVPCGPCRAHERTGATIGCPQQAASTDEADRYCAGLRAIDPQRIANAVQEILP